MATDTELRRHRQHESECPKCSEFMSEMRSTIQLLARFNELKLQGLGEQAANELFRAWKAGEVLSNTSEWNEEAEEFLERLVTESPQGQLDLFLSSKWRYSNSFKDLCISRTLELGSHDPQKALAMGKVAVILADHAEPESEEFGGWYQLQIRTSLAHAAFANARRICSDHLGAFRSLRRADEAVEALGENSLALARILQIKAHLLSDCQKFDDSEDCLREAMDIYEYHGATHMKGRTALALGAMLGRSGKPELASQVIQGGLGQVDPSREPRLLLVAKHNLVHFLFDSGHFVEALDLLPEVRALHMKLGNAVDIARLEWLEGQIALEKEEWEVAETAFVQVRDFFVEKGLAHDVACVSLDLATVYLKQNRLSELKQLSVEMLAIFEGLGTQKESRAALAFFRKAIELERAQVEMVGNLLDYLAAVRLEERVEARLSVPT